MNEFDTAARPRMQDLPLFSPAITSPTAAPKTHAAPGNEWANGNTPGAFNALRGEKPKKSAAALPNNDVLEEDEWHQAALLQPRAADRLSEATRAHREVSTVELSSEETEALGHDVIARVVEDTVQNQSVSDGGQVNAWNEIFQAKVRDALFSLMFRLGRLQPFLDDETITNVHLLGTKVFIKRIGEKQLQPAPPIVDSEEKLAEMLAHWASTKETGGREFSVSKPQLRVDLPAGELQVRVNAERPPFAQHVSAVIRIHRHLDISLEQLVAMGSLTPVAAHFLATAVSAGTAIAVSGPPGVGKTTMMRALAEKIDPFVQVVTIEDERELYLERLSSRVVPPISLEQVLPGESGQGGLDMYEGTRHGLRANAQYEIVGEVSGTEIAALLRAMQIGVGTMTTVHGTSVEAGLDNLITLGLPVYGRELMTRLLAYHLDLIVQVDEVKIGEKWKSVVTGISEVMPSADGERGVATLDLFRLEPGGDAEQAAFIRGPEDSHLRNSMERAGLDPGLLEEKGAL